jgi:hypothetical protein
MTQAREAARFRADFHAIGKPVGAGFEDELNARFWSAELVLPRHCLAQRLGVLVATLVATTGELCFLGDAVHFVGVDDAVADEEHQQHDQTRLEPEGAQIVVQLVQQHGGHHCGSYVEKRKSVTRTLRPKMRMITSRPGIMISKDSPNVRFQRPPNLGMSVTSSCRRSSSPARSYCSSVQAMRACMKG